MTLKEIAYAVKHALEQVTRTPFRHAHVHELLAACFGFRSRAALHANHVLAQFNQSRSADPAHLLVLKDRLTELGYASTTDAAGSCLAAFIASNRLAALSVESVIAGLSRHDWYHQGELDEEDEDALGNLAGEFLGLSSAQIDLLIHGLSDLAKRGHPKAHYALALLYRWDKEEGEEGSEYWYSQQAQGNDLSGDALAWAKAYERKIDHPQLEVFHLQQAARLGVVPAQLELAQHAGREAEMQGDYETAKRSYLEAATLGDVDAMRALIGGYDPDNLFQNWVWVFFSELLGQDLRQSSLRAYHDGGMFAGEIYDDDQGGPLYVDGEEGVELDPLTEEQAMAAKHIANELFERRLAR